MSNKLKRRSPNYSSNRLQSAGNAAGVICCTNVRADPKYFLLENNNGSSVGSSNTPLSSACGLDPARTDTRAGRWAHEQPRHRREVSWGLKSNHTHRPSAEEATLHVFFAMCRTLNLRCLVCKWWTKFRVHAESFFFSFSFLLLLSIYRSQISTEG